MNSKNKNNTKIIFRHAEFFFLRERFYSAFFETETKTQTHRKHTHTHTHTHDDDNRRMHVKLIKEEEREGGGS